MTHVCACAYCRAAACRYYHFLGQSTKSLLFGCTGARCKIDERLEVLNPSKSYIDGSEHPYLRRMSAIE